MATRRAELAEAATDYALEHGLIGLSLRPLAEALGTSDRMLLYHFRDKDDLVATILRTSTARSMEGIKALPAAPDLREAVRSLWREVSTGPQQRCQRLYVAAAALGLFGQEPYAAEVRDANTAWMGVLWPTTSPAPGWTRSRRRRPQPWSTPRSWDSSSTSRSTRPTSSAGRSPTSPTPSRRAGALRPAARSPRGPRRAARRRAGSRGSGCVGRRRARPAPSHAH